VTLEPATPAHAEALAHIHASAFPPGQRWGADAMALQLGLPGVFGWIALVAGLAEGGMVLARVAADEAEILTLAVDPAARGLGVGRALLGRAMQTASSRDAASMVLEVAATNKAARALYSGRGFREVGRRVAYYPGPVDALILRAAIPFGSAGT
jgi:[ribosomal protein S18]-alanine N-acetyltransferase